MTGCRRLGIYSRYTQLEYIDNYCNKILIWFLDQSRSQPTTTLTGSYLVCYLESSIHTLGITEQRGSSFTQLYHDPLAGSVGPDCVNQVHGSNFKELFQELAVSPTGQCLLFEYFTCSLKSFGCYLGEKHAYVHVHVNMSYFIW